MKLFAVRGATSVEEDKRDAILTATTELLTAILNTNGIGIDEIVSCMFTCTPDLTSEFPAVAARDLGFQAVPLLCAQEINVTGAVPSIVRTLMHYYADEQHQTTHIYLGRAKALREDLHSAQ